MIKLSIYDSNKKIGVLILTNQSIAIGRDSASDIQIDHVKVSRNHAKITLVNGNWVLEDLNSKNGTLVNKEKILYKELRTGDKIRIGNYWLRFDNPVKDSFNSLMQELEAAETPSTIVNARSHSSIKNNLRKILEPRQAEAKVKSKAIGSKVKNYFTSHFSFFRKFKFLLVFIVCSHWLFADNLPGREDEALKKQWNNFVNKYEVGEFGKDGYFVRAARNGHALFYKTYDYAWRFTRKTATDKNNSCASCHTPKEIAFSFLQSDRYDTQLGKRVSFEEKVMRCYVKRMQGFVPTIYEPAVRDIRILARIVAHNLKLTEGAYKIHDHQKKRKN